MVLNKTLAKKRAWKAFSTYIRKRGSRNGNNRCVTCKKVYPVKSLQAGHWIPGRHNAVLFDERNCHPQCYACNIGRKGNPIEYYHFMERKYGKDVMEELEELDHQIVQYKVNDYLELEAYYKFKTDKNNLNETQTKEVN